MEVQKIISLITVIILGICVQSVTPKSRGGSFSRGSSFRSTSYRASTSRTSYSSNSISRTSYSGSRLYSSYVSYVPSVRYSRAYGGYRGYYYSYYMMYFYYAPRYAYYRRSGYNDADGQGVCVNYEANDNGTYMGVFTCPLPFEPTEFTACCGDQYAEYCCEASVSSSSMVYIVIGVILVLIMGCLLVYVLVRKCNHKNKVISRPPPPINQRRGPNAPVHVPNNQPGRYLNRNRQATVGNVPPNQHYNNAAYNVPYPVPANNTYPVAPMAPVSVDPAYPPGGAPPYPAGGNPTMPMPAPYDNSIPMTGPPAYNDAVKDRPPTGGMEKPPQYSETEKF